MKLISPPQENFFYFRERKPRKKFLYFLKRELFLYFRKQKLRNFRKLLILQEVTCKARKTKKKSALKTFLLSYDVFAIFTSVEHMKIPCEAKNKTEI